MNAATSAGVIVLPSCTGCGACVSRCPRRAITLASEFPGGRGRKRAVIAAEGCTACGDCLPACPRQALARANLFAAIPATLPEELVEVLSSSSAVRIERIVSRGHTSPEGFWYDQEWAEFVVLLSGAARLEFADGAPPLDLHPGDWLMLAARRRHRVTWTDPTRNTVWLAVHCRPDEP